MIATEIAVGLGEAHVASARASDNARRLVAYGLGSCIALCLWDPHSELAAMAHIVLPGEDPSGSPNPKYAQSALPALFKLMRANGASADQRKYVARLAGGAQVLKLGGSGSLPRVGDQNAQAIQAALADAGVRVHAHDLGGTQGRSVWFDPCEGGRIRVRAIGQPDHYL